MNGVTSSQPISQWDENAVVTWLGSIGFSQYEQSMKENGVAGDVLCRLDLEFLKEIGIGSIGQRVAILKAVYQLKLAHAEPFEPGDYIPPSEAEEKQDMTVERLHRLIQEQSDRLRTVEQENRRFQERLQVCFEELNNVQTKRIEEERGLHRQRSMKFELAGKPAYSPTKPLPDVVANESPHPSPSRAEHEASTHSSRPNREAENWDSSRGPARAMERSNSSSLSPTQSASQSRGSPANSRGDVQDALRSFKITLEDPTWRVLPAVLKKYKIKDEDWRKYALFIAYSNTERCLGFDEKPLLIFRRLWEANKNPVFLLKHMRDLHSPIAQAAIKHQARLKERGDVLIGKDHVIANSKSTPSSHQPTRSGNSGSLNAPPTSASPEASSPTAEQRGDDDPRPRAMQAFDDMEKELGDLKLSYAIAIYPYLAEQDDEFNVNVGDTFVIFSRGKGWWSVQRDKNGYIDLDPTKQGWVPAGCLLETMSPVTCTDPSQSITRVPIPPSNILTTSYPGVALVEYKAKTDDEIDLSIEDQLRVFKRYNYWSYVVKEESGRRGWAPSWFIGKAPPGVSPPTPSYLAQPPLSVTGPPIKFASVDSHSHQLSPLSNAFPSSKSTPGL